MTPQDRSVWGQSTDEHKAAFREYLRDLAQRGEDYRSGLIDRLEWCFDVWEDWRQKLYSETSSPLLNPFFQAHDGGSAFGHYTVCGNSGQPSVISIKRSMLMGDYDLRLARVGNRSIVLKKGPATHPTRLKVLQLVILHEMVHQYLHEGASAATRNSYEQTECSDGKKQRYKGHGSLFAAECNRVGEHLFDQLGMDFVPVRHMKRDRGAAIDRQRPSCGQFGWLNVFFKWDTTSEELTPEQREENEVRLKEALRYFGDGIEVEEQDDTPTDFTVEFAANAADICFLNLSAYDRAYETNLTRLFEQRVLQSLAERGQLSAALEAAGLSAAQLDIQAVDREESTDVTPEEADAVIRICEEAVRSIDPVPTAGDAKPSIAKVYPLKPDPADSLARLEADIKAAGSARELCVGRFGCTDGSMASRQAKKLRQAVELQQQEVVAA